MLIIGALNRIRTKDVHSINYEISNIVVNFSVFPLKNAVSCKISFTERAQVSGMESATIAS